MDNEQQAPRFLKRGLEAERYRVNIARDGRSGARFFPLRPSNLIVVGILEPTSGLELLRALHAALRSSHSPLRQLQNIKHSPHLDFAAFFDEVLSSGNQSFSRFRLQSPHGNPFTSVRRSTTQADPHETSAPER